MGERERSPTRGIFIKGAMTQEDAEDISNKEKEARINVVSKYNESHEGANLELEKLKINHGLVLLSLRYTTLPSLVNLNRLLNETFIGPVVSDRHMAFDYKQLSPNSMVAYVPLSRVRPARGATAQTSTKQKFLKLMFVVFVVLVCVAAAVAVAPPYEELPRWGQTTVQQQVSPPPPVFAPLPPPLDIIDSK